MSRTFLKLIALVLLPGVLGIAAFGQEVRASLTGLVSDPTGAPVSGATVTVTNLATQTSLTAASNEAGNYAIPFLAPGTYKMTVEQAGFKKYVRENIILQAMDKGRVDVSLELGQLADSVTVKDSFTVLQTESASRSQLISQQLVKDVPTQGRNIFQLAWSAAGVVKSGEWRYLRSWDSGGTSGFSVNGGRNKENEVLLDGISNVQADRTVIHVPTVETVQEFKVLTNTYDAQYGRTGGGIVSIVTKGGGNEFHGSAFENWQGSALNANTWELNKAGSKKPPAVINTFGVNASGPVIIPKLFNGRNRLFWMLSREGVRQRNADPGVYNFPQDNWRQGDFSDLRNSSGTLVQIYDPLTIDKSTGNREAFPGNQIPASRISTLAKKAFSYYPSPNAMGDPITHVNNYIFPSRWIANMDAWIGRMDFQLNSKNNFYFRYGQNPYEEYRSLVFVSDINTKNPAEPSGNSPLRRNGRTFTFDWTSTISPTMAFDLRAGLNRWEYVGGSTMGRDYDLSQLGFSQSLISQIAYQQFPQLNLGSYQRLGSSVLNFGTDDTYSLQPNLNAVMGRHFMKVGFEARQYKDNRVDPGYASGNYTFDKVWTQSNMFQGNKTSGNEVASFLLGYPASGYVDRNINPAWLHRYYALFFNDDFKITSRLTLNLGLRWDYESPNYERYNRMVRGLDLDAASPIASKVSGFDAKGAVLFAGVNGQPRGSFAPDKNNFQPRVGAAYRLGEKWVIRAGYGLYYLGQNENGSTQGFSRNTSIVNSNDGYLPAVTMDDPFANYANGQLLQPIGSSLGAASFLGETITANWLNRPLPYSHQYSFDIQRELPGNILVEFGYVGNQTRKLPLKDSNNAPAVNYVPADQLGKRTSSGAIDTAWYNAKVANPFAGLIPNNAALNGATIQRYYLMYAYPQYPNSLLYSFPIGSSRYDGFQAKFSKRYSHGFTAIASYSLMKNLEQTNLLNPQDLNRADPESTKLEKRSAKEIDIPQRFVITGVWELPFGKNRPWGAHAPKIVDYIIGGWQMNFDVSYTSGWVWDYPNTAQVKPGSAKLDNPTRDHWFDTSLWTGAKGQEAYTLRNYPTRFSDVRGPGYQNWDASVSKYFALSPKHENLRLQLRGEMINAFNHAWMGNPATTDYTSGNFGKLNQSQGNLPRWIKLAGYLYW